MGVEHRPRRIDSTEPDDDEPAGGAGDGGVQQLAADQWRIGGRVDDGDRVVLGTLALVHREGVGDLDGVELGEVEGDELTAAAEHRPRSP